MLPPVACYHVTILKTLFIAILPIARYQILLYQRLHQSDESYHKLWPILMYYVRQHTCAMSKHRSANCSKKPQAGEVRTVTEGNGPGHHRNGHVILLHGTKYHFAYVRDIEAS